MSIKLLRIYFPFAEVIISKLSKFYNSLNQVSSNKWECTLINKNSFRIEISKKDMKLIVKHLNGNEDMTNEIIMKFMKEKS